MKKVPLFIIIFYFFSTMLCAQNALYSFKFENIPLASVLDEITVVSGYNFVFVNEVLPKKTITQSWENVTIEEIIRDILVDEIVSYLVNGKTITMYSTRSLTNPFQVFGQLTNSADGEYLTGANVYTNASQGVTSDQYGLYSIEINPERDSLLIISYLGFKTQIFEINRLKQGRRDIKLSSDLNILKTVIITQSTQKQLPAIPPKDILKANTYFASKAISGDQDILEYLNALPGITKMSEGRSGFSVHGSGVDQNLILIDDAPIFNPGHALGFLSVFNHEALNSATFYKTDISARYGGRLASVLDVRMREGNARKKSATVSTNPFYSGLTIEGPVLKDKMSFLASSRISHFNYILDRFEPVREFYIPQQINFYDVHAKLNFRLGQNNRFYISSFINHDEIVPYKSSNEIFFYDTQWQNRTLTFRWNTIWSDKLFTNASFVFSDYEYEKSATADSLRYKYIETSNISNVHLKLEGNYYISKSQKLNFGVNGTNYVFSPATGSISVPANNFELRYKIPDINSRELALFLEDNIKIARKANINIGLRYSRFYDVGNGTPEYIYNDFDQRIDSTARRKNTVIRTFDNFEPRIAVAAQLSDKVLLQSSWSRTSQYIIRLLNENPASPNEYWIPAGLYVKPLVSNIVSSGLQWDATQFVKFDLNVFARNSKNVTTFKNGSNIFFSESLIDRQITQGDFKSSGIEFSISKSKNNFRYLFSYTFTDVEVQFDDINNGKPFSAAQHYQHDFNLQTGLILSEKVNVGVNWQVRSGDRISLPAGFGYIGGLPFAIYRERNNYTLPAYQRIDVSSNWSILRNSRCNIDLSVGVYNVTGQLNPFQVAVERDISLPRIEILALSRVTPFLHLKLRYL